jgi:hypothetical protein
MYQLSEEKQGTQAVSCRQPTGEITAAYWRDHRNSCNNKKAVMVLQRHYCTGLFPVDGYMDRIHLMDKIVHRGVILFIYNSVHYFILIKEHMLLELALELQLLSTVMLVSTYQRLVVHENHIKCLCAFPKVLITAISEETSRTSPGFKLYVSRNTNLANLLSFPPPPICLMPYLYNTVTNSRVLFHDGTLLHSKCQYTTVKHSLQLLEHTYTSDPHGLGTLIPSPIEFFQRDLLWKSSITHSSSCSQKASKHTSGQSVVGLSVHLHTTTALRRIVHH